MYFTPLTLFQIVLQGDLHIFLKNPKYSIRKAALGRPLQVIKWVQNAYLLYVL